MLDSTNWHIGKWCQKLRERAWYATEGEKAIGTVIFDGNDNDWAYVIMEEADDGNYRCVENDSSIATETKATANLRKAMERR